MPEDIRFDERPCSVRKTKSNNAWKKDELVVLARASGLPKWTTYKNKAQLCKALAMKHSDVDMTRQKSTTKKLPATKVPIGEEGAALANVPKPKPRPSKSKTKELFAAGSKFPGVPLMAHQIEVVERMLNPCIRGLILYFGVGSGKTLSSMAAAEALMNHGIVKSVLVVTPASLIANYKKELTKFHAKANKYDIMSFEAFTKKAESGTNLTKDKLLVVDEAHNLRNASGQRSKAIFAQAKNATKVLLLTGTPVQNAPSDIAPLANMLKKHNEIPNTKDSFDRHFGASGLESEQALLKKTLECCMLYYAPSSSDPEYPSISTENVEVKMTERQREAQLAFADDNPNMELEDIVQDKSSIMTFFSAPRRAANILRQRNQPSDAPKFVEALQRIKTAHAKGEKSIAYSNFLEAGVNILADMLKDAHIEYLMVTGKESKAKKQHAIEEYNKGKVKVLLLSSAGGEGHDLKGTNHVHIMEPAFNSPRVEQVIGRARRRGSHADTPKKHVSVYKYYAIMNATSSPSANGFGMLQNWSADQILRWFSETKDEITRKFLKKVLDWNAAAKQKCLKC